MEATSQSIVTMDEREWFGVRCREIGSSKALLVPTVGPTLADLSPIDLKRWYASHKISIVFAGVRGGLITAGEICRPPPSFFGRTDTLGKCTR
jgi:hypothetical protein